jgi:glycine oxidase
VKTSADTVVVGGGVIGLALARELSSRGCDVVVVERGRTGEEASSAAAGLLSAQSDAESPSPFFDLARKSRDFYPEWTALLEEETGIDVGWRRTGVLRLGAPESLERFAWQLEAGLPLERVEAPEIARRSAGRAAPGLRHGLFFPEDAVVDNRSLVWALRRSLDRRGVAVLEDVPATRFLVEAGRCRGVETTIGPIRSDSVVDSAGAWANFDAALPFGIPVEPVRGQIVELTDKEPFPIVLASEDVYLVPRSNGRILIGATVERAGFRKEVTAGGVHSLLAAALVLAPTLEGARMTCAWAGLRPGTPDGFPIIGESPVSGLFLATGHFRNGILLAPLTAVLVADMLTRVTAEHPSLFSPERFVEAARGR